MMNTRIFIVILLILLCTGLTHAATSETLKYPAGTTNTANSADDANFIIKVIKYEPFPVNPGDWFDLWIKIENTGQNDALNLQTELKSDSTFEVENPVKKFGAIPGILQAYKYKQELNDKDIETNQVLMKYHVGIKDSALTGSNNIEFQIRTDETNNSLIYHLPIEIAKTKTDFNVNLNMISPEGAVFTISNIGDNTAKAMNVGIEDNDEIELMQKYSPVTIGDIQSGNVANALLRVLPNEQAKEITLVISYTDTANVRTTIKKTIQITKETIKASKTDFEATLNDMSPQETIIAISNIGNFLAKSVSVEIKDNKNVILLGKYAPVSLGDLNSGDVALVHLKILPKENAKDLTFLIHYTDSSQVRRTSEKSVTITKDTINSLCPPSVDNSYFFWIFGAVGFLIGVFLVILVVVIRSPKRRNKIR